MRIALKDDPLWFRLLSDNLFAHQLSQKQKTIFVNELEINFPQNTPLNNPNYLLKYEW